MDKLKKFELMEKIVRELEDLKRSQQAVLEKIGKIEVDNIELGDSRLERVLPDIYQRTAENSDAITELLNSFAEKTDDFAAKNNVNQLRQQQELTGNRNT
ncbi:hypothetical protein JHJ32_10625 [Parapedobacter sp. ISTM3]|uniref:Uncharacterized protein n=1 Tax=Parapedobacter luteus TaxID=623280 RepID=A0A1T5B1D5_9SPHI|nr:MULTISPECIES: hypothetical protein [Parapedobacter]MBK1440440.1 hypothetical protein [Parapedobacter sp. ISTM3]SKB41111.1 hypothetical protein SAMN05660226_01264 [Parapedobacter luteus]